MTRVRVATCAPWRGGGAGDRHHQPGVVDLAVVVADRAGDRVGLEVGGDPGDLPAEQVPVPRHAHLVLAEHRQRVVQREPGADVGPLPPAVGQRVEERHRPDQVRGQPGQQQPALLQRLAHQPEVEHLEVAQPAVDELAAATAGAAGQVALLEQTGVQAAGHRVERGADARPRRRRRPGRRAHRRRSSRRSRRRGRPVPVPTRSVQWAGSCGRFFQAPTQPCGPPESRSRREDVRGDPFWPLSSSSLRRRSRRSAPPPTAHRRSGRSPRQAAPTPPVPAVPAPRPEPATGTAYRHRGDGRRPALAQHGVGERGRGRGSDRGAQAATTSTRCSPR